METLDSAEFDLQGQSLNEAVALIADLNNITDPNQILTGMPISIPADTAALQALMEQNADKLSTLDYGFASVDFSPPEVIDSVSSVQPVPVPLTADQQLLQVAITEASSPEKYSSMIAENMVSDSDALSDSLSGFKDSDLLTQEIQDKMQANIQNQIEKGTFPVPIELSLSDQYGKETQIVFSAEKLTAMNDLAIEGQKSQIELLSAKLESSVSATSELAETGEVMEMPNNGKTPEVPNTGEETKSTKGRKMT